MPRQDQYVRWPHEIARLVREGHTFPECRDQTASSEFGLFSAFCRHSRNRHAFEQRRRVREQAARRELHREYELLGGLIGAQNDLHAHYELCSVNRFSADEGLWFDIKRQFLNGVSSRVADYLLRVAPWHEVPASRYEALFSIKSLCARLSFGREGYDGLLQEAIDRAAQKLRKQKFKVRFHAVHRYQETVPHDRCTGSCAMRCFETHDTYNLEPQHKSSRTLTQLTDPAAYLYNSPAISRLSSEFSISISFKVA